MRGVFNDSFTSPAAPVTKANNPSADNKAPRLANIGRYLALEQRYGAQLRDLYEEVTASIEADSSNNITLATGVVGNCLPLRSAGSQDISFKTVATSQPITNIGYGGVDNPWSHSFWYKANALAANYSVISGVWRTTLSNTNDKQWCIQRDINQNVYLVANQGPAYNNYVYASLPANSTPDGEWHMLTATYADDVLSFYLDDGTVSSSTALIGGPYRIVEATASRPWFMNRGTVGDAKSNFDTDEVSFWNVALNKKQIKWMYNKGNGRAFSEYK